jgi:2-oxoisovalerate dehydrogenase E2 component (dihydrolipoyl transacylase)
VTKKQTKRSLVTTPSSTPATTISTPSLMMKKTTMKQNKRFMSSVAVSGNVGDVIGFPLADIGEGITEVEVLKWFINQGDHIVQFQKICEVQSDKANVEITSRYDGIVESLECQVGQMAQVGSPLIKIKLTTATAGAKAKKETKSEEAKTAPAACPLASATPKVTQTSNSVPVSRRADTRILSPPRDPNNVLASPVVRLRAKTLGINLGHVKPTGSRGQITPEDLAQYHEEIQEIDANPQSSVSATPTTLTTPTTPAASVINVVADAKPAKQEVIHAVPQRGASQAKADQVIQVAGIQKVMVKTMTNAAAIPTFGYSDEICVDELIKVRGLLVNKAKQHGVKLSYFAFIIKALSLALDKYPQVNAHVNSDCSQITQKGSHNIGLAMDTPKGLLVPNIKNVQNLSILEIGAELNRLQTLGSQGKLGPDDLKGGTITLSNIGTIGGTYCSPVLVVPEAAIGALGKFYTKAAFDAKGQVYPSTVFNIGWTADHRALDGASVAKFSNEMKHYIENPQEMMLY